MSESVTISRQCSNGGYLVGPAHRVPEDERYFQTPEARFYVGCNRLVCRLCGGSVRQQVGWRDGPGAGERARAIYDDRDWSRSPFLVSDADSRLYACGCSVVVVAKGQATVMPNRTWECAGHPPVEAGPGAGLVLPPIAADAATALAFHLANSQLTESIKMIAFTRTDGSGELAFPAVVGLGGGWPRLKVFTADDSVNSQDVDFTTVAGACVQLKDGTLRAF